MADVSERLLKLRPVTFRYKPSAAQGDKSVQYGLIAEEVAEVFPELVVFDKDGRPDAVKYQVLTPILLNELKLQKRQFAEQLNSQAAQNRELTERINTQAEQVRRLEAAVAALQASPQRNTQP